MGRLLERQLMRTLLLIACAALFMGLAGCGTESGTLPEGSLPKGGPPKQEKHPPGLADDVKNSGRYR